MATATKKMPITSDPEANQLLMDEPLALLIGMLLDQQVPMEWAFMGPATLKRRFGGELDAHAIAAMSEDEVVAVFCEKPAVHRFPAAMGRRAHGMCEIIVDKYDGDAGAIWRNVRSADEVYRRLRELPGYGEEKTKIFMAILAKRLGRKPDRVGRGRRPVLGQDPAVGRRRRARPPPWPRSASSRRPRRPPARARPTDSLARCELVRVAHATRGQVGRERNTSGAGGAGDVALAVEPAEHDRHGPRVVAQLVAGAVDDPQVGVAVGIGQHPGVEHRHRLVVGPVEHQEWPRVELRRRRHRRGSRAARATTSRTTGGTTTSG